MSSVKKKVDMQKAENLRSKNSNFQKKRSQSVNKNSEDHRKLDLLQEKSRLSEFTKFQNR